MKIPLPRQPGTYKDPIQEEDLLIHLSRLAQCSVRPIHVL